MRRPTKQKTVNFLANILMVIASLSSGFVIWVLKIDVRADLIQYQLPEWILQTLLFIQAQAIWIWIVSAIMNVMGYVLKKFSGFWVLEKIQYVLDKVQNQAFADFSGDVVDHHRVTLFEYRRIVIYPNGKWWWHTNYSWKPWTGWLVPILRSNYTSKKTNVCFSCPDDGQKAQGIAGKAWASDTACCVDKLPNISDASSIINKERYANKSYTNVEYLSRKIRDKQVVALSNMK